ncbi:MAG: hypothetical protein HFI53_08770 [Lachnospiraceae bacterium]|nr:hypothetical protein [Lachnospiraceae bacterium]
MIYRVGDGDNPAYDYSSQLKPAKNAESQEKFSLDRQKEQAVPEKKEEKGEDKKLHEKPGVDIRKQGVRLELSGKEESGEQTEKRDVRANGNTPMSGSLLALFKDLFQSVKDFLYKLWNEPSEETVISEDVTPEEAERYTEEYYALKGIDPKVREAERDEKIRKQLRSGNLEQVISLLTDDGRRTMAKNSTLLTYYDKSGKLTQLSASDKERILHGDRHVREL